jgi:hypothetical protein
MVLQRHVPSNAPRAWRMLGLAAAYSLAMVTGTALLIAAFSGMDDSSRVTGSDGQKLTAAEVVMQQAAERAMQQQQAPQTMVLASSRNGFLTNDKRGL